MKNVEDDVLATLAMLRRHINPLESPLYRLPSDLFPEIASHLTRDTDLVNATHVSYHLRNILLSHPSLWSHLNFEREQRARAFFERLGQALLHVDMSRDTARMADLLTGLRRQSNRIATLKLRHWSVQKMILSEPLPSLRRLEILSDHSSDWEKERDIVWALWRPMKNTTSWSFPSLTSLVVYDLDPSLFYTPRLTRFKFWECENITDTDKLLSFFDNCPLLEHIDIFYMDERQSGHDLVASLPSLRTYTQTTFGNACSLAVLNMLSLPPFCSVTLRFQNGGETTAEADNILPRFKDPDYLAEIKRVKLRTTHDADGNEVAGVLELVNIKGTMVRSERMGFEEEEIAQGGSVLPHNAVHLNFLKNLDCQSVEVLCVDGCAWQDRVAVEFLKEVLGLGNVRTLILSRSAMVPCLSALNEDPGTNGHNLWFLPIHTLIICPDSTHFYFHDVLQPLLSIAQKRKLAGFPFRSVFLFLWSYPRSGWDQVLE